MKHLVSTSHLKSFQATHQICAAIKIVEAYYATVAAHRHTLERRTLTHQLRESILPTHGKICQSLAHLLFLRRVNLVDLMCIHQVLGAHYATVRNHLWEPHSSWQALWLCVWQDNARLRLWSGWHPPQGNRRSRARPFPCCSVRRTPTPRRQARFSP